MLIFNNTLCIQSLLGDFLVVLWISSVWGKVLRGARANCCEGAGVVSAWLCFLRATFVAGERDANRWGLTGAS